ncbi:MAG: Vi polysaccharide biosynthesis UDP-N-acetylglucosamine C-6 dehydrogenase TviB, partial [Pseudomonadales bacterium]|nr:Vi polysaccharide biosynthesis UDP-N-acetylglucosamine C-6 dehydrogenase TviB [Pseudomonadales bacterium]
MSSNPPDLNNVKVAVIGLGYVGLPLAVELGRLYPTIGFDVNVSRIEELRAGRDYTREVDAEALASPRHLSFSSETADLRAANFY